MAVITSYTNLQTAVGDYLARDNLTTFIPNFIQNAENKLYRTLKLRDMETSFSTAISNGTITIPLRYLSLKYAYVNATPVQWLSRVPPEELYRDYAVRSASGTPKVLTEEEGVFIFGPFPDSTYTIKGIYYQAYSPLRTTSPNWVVTNAPELLLYGALLEAAPFIGDDPRLETWGQFYKGAIDTLEEEKRLEQYSGGSLVQKAR